MNIVLNGAQRTVEVNATLLELLDALHVARAGIAVLLNGELIAIEALAQTTLTEGDAIDVVHMVGGG